MPILAESLTRALDRLLGGASEPAEPPAREITQPALPTMAPGVEIIKSLSTAHGVLLEVRRTKWPPDEKVLVAWTNETEATLRNVIEHRLADKDRRLGRD